LFIIILTFIPCAGFPFWTPARRRGRIAWISNFNKTVIAFIISSSYMHHFDRRNNNSGIDKFTYELYYEEAKHY